ncbi:hypothetical protein WJX72_005498 [[Myrmecia] bisecta]|uniref:4a-hydroxytetrahydrobiopterin dehydratase n=1 Tax=[Myrmecia] bisecta TaxID=41462 RepID=A0AAW1PT16_9CHLO
MGSALLGSKLLPLRGAGAQRCSRISFSPGTPSHTQVAHTLVTHRGLCRHNTAEAPQPRTVARAEGGGLRDGEFGARDPFPAEIASNFGDKVLGNWDTSHVIRGPAGMEKITGLKAKRCIPCEGEDVKVLSESDADWMRNQVPGWRLTKDAAGVPCLRHEWKVRNFKAGLELFNRIGKIAEEEGHHPDLHLEGFNTVYAQLSTHSVGGLTENDFIMAAKINDVPVEDLVPKKKPKFWL